MLLINIYTWTRILKCYPNKCWEVVGSNKTLFCPALLVFCQPFVKFRNKTPKKTPIKLKYSRQKYTVNTKFYTQERDCFIWCCFLLSSQHISKRFFVITRQLILCNTSLCIIPAYIVILNICNCYFDSYLDIVAPSRIVPGYNYGIEVDLDAAYKDGLSGDVNVTVVNSPYAWANGVRVQLNKGIINSFVEMFEHIVQYYPIKFVNTTSTVVTWQ